MKALTDEQIQQLFRECFPKTVFSKAWEQFARAVESAAIQQAEAVPSGKTCFSCGAPVDSMGKPIAPQPAQSEQPEAGVVDDLSALVARLARSLSKAAPDNKLPADALDYLKRHALTGSPLRDESNSAQAKEGE